MPPSSSQPQTPSTPSAATAQEDSHKVAHTPLKTLIVLDGLVLLASLAYVGWQLVLISIVGMVVLNAILTINHRQDCYIAY